MKISWINTFRGGQNWPPKIFHARGGATLGEKRLESNSALLGPWSVALSTAGKIHKFKTMGKRTMLGCNTGGWDCCTASAEKCVKYFWGIFWWILMFTVHIFTMYTYIYIPTIHLPFFLHQLQSRWRNWCVTNICWIYSRFVLLHSLHRPGVKFMTFLVSLQVQCHTTLWSPYRGEAEQNGRGGACQDISFQSLAMRWVDWRGESAFLNPSDLPEVRFSF